MFCCDSHVLHKEHPKFNYKIDVSPLPPFRKKKKPREINNILNSMTSKSSPSLSEEVCLPVAVQCKCRVRRGGDGMQ